MRQLLLLTLYLILAIPFTATAQGIDTVRVYFGSGQHQLIRQHKQQLKSVVQIATHYPGYKLMVLGFADNVGSEELNQELSEKRTMAVVSYLLSKGIKKSQIVKAMGKGAITKPGGFAGVKGSPKDRRVEVYLRQPLTGPDALLNLREGETLVLKTLTFLPGRHILREEAKPELEKLTLLLRQNPGLKIEIQGHICCENRQDGRDLDTGQDNLSVSRAKYVYDYLVANGIDPDRLSYKGFGRTKPLVRLEETEEDRNLNRRVEIKLLKK